MESVPTIGHKRSRSAADSQSNLQEATSAARETTRNAPRVLLVHLSALLSCNDAVIRVIPAILADILPANDIPSFTDEDALRAFSKSPILQHILQELGVRPLSYDESVRLQQVYWRIFYDLGAPLITLVPGASELLDATKRHGQIALAVLAHNTAEAAKVLADAGVGHLVDTILPALPAETYASENPDPRAFWSHWGQFVMPWFTAYCDKASGETDQKPGADAAGAAANGSTTTPMTDTPIPSDDTNNDASDEAGSKAEAGNLVPERALLVSSVLADLSAAKASSGIQTCWFRRIDAADPLVTGSASGLFDLVIGGLDELRAHLSAEVDGRGGDDSSSVPATRCKEEEENEKKQKKEEEDAREQDKDEVMGDC
ncbi:uncharacterized protein P884DRAFT_300314 [Thermothelomyces heterothallicus CBS 202.75]|uniref:uncharacterized protein n=1 Tax=Thermothelomyces heterothallicus CBS 202.75 TaxID=1149848 RepID=UPI003744A924